MDLLPAKSSSVLRLREWWSKNWMLALISAQVLLWLYSYENMVKVKATALFGCQEQHLFQSFSVEFPPLAARAVWLYGSCDWFNCLSVFHGCPGRPSSCWETFVTCSAASVNMHEGNRRDLLLRCCFYCNVIRIFSFGLCSLCHILGQDNNGILRIDSTRIDNVFCIYPVFCCFALFCCV